MFKYCHLYWLFISSLLLSSLLLFHYHVLSGILMSLIKKDSSIFRQLILTYSIRNYTPNLYRWMHAECDDWRWTWNEKSTLELIACTCKETIKQVRCTEAHSDLIHDWNIFLHYFVIIKYVLIIIIYMHHYFLQLFIADGACFVV